VIKSQELKKKVNAAGNAALGLLFANHGWEAFLACCRQFSLESGLAIWCGREMASNPRSSMAMLGHTIFSDAPLFLLHKPFMLMKAKTSKDGAKIL
jgi:pantoate kinase